MKKDLDEIIEKHSAPPPNGALDSALRKCGEVCTTEYEEIIELWRTYGGN